MTGIPSHANLEHFEVVDNCLVFGGRKITELADAAGTTPFYAYDKSLIDRRIRYLRSKLPADIDLHYAVKANPMPDLVSFIADRLDGLDIASAGELAVALRTSMSPSSMSFAGPGKRVSELELAVDAGITVTVESFTELDRVIDIARQKDRLPRLAVRVNPDFELKSSGMRMSGGPKQFGIDAEQIDTVIDTLGKEELDLLGFHIFCGSQNLDEDALIEAQRETVDLGIKLAKKVRNPLEFINIGGGFGIPYFPGDSAIRLDRIGSELSGQKSRLAQELGESCRLVLELGRYIVGEAGIYVCRVLDRKISRGKTYLVTDGGMHHHLAASGNFGQVLRKNYPVTIGNKINGDQMESQSIVGPLCTPLDLLAENVSLPAATIDDLVVVFQSGAYGYTASPHLFLSHPPPTEILV